MMASLRPSMKKVTTTPQVHSGHYAHRIDGTLPHALLTTSPNVEYVALVGIGTAHNRLGEELHGVENSSFPKLWHFPLLLPLFAPTEPETLHSSRISRLYPKIYSMASIHSTKSSQDCRGLLDLLLNLSGHVW